MCGARHGFGVGRLVVRVGNAHLGDPMDEGLVHTSLIACRHWIWE